LNVAIAASYFALSHLCVADAKPRRPPVDAAAAGLRNHFLVSLLRFGVTTELGQRRGEPEARGDRGIGIRIGVGCLLKARHCRLEPVALRPERSWLLNGWRAAWRRRRRRDDRRFGDRERARQQARCLRITIRSPREEATATTIATIAIVTAVVTSRLRPDIASRARATE
jgi:hypothetical protein